MREWESIAASEYCVSVRDGTHDSPKPVERDGCPLVTSKMLKNGVVDVADAYLISRDDFEKINQRSKVDRWDVLMSMIGTVGECVLVKDEPNYAIKNMALFKFGGDESRAKWFYYFLTSSIGQSQLRGNFRGSSQQFVSLGQLRALKVPNPPLPTQRKIAAILSDYDAAIANCRKQIALLEEAAQRLYREWFADGKGEKKAIGEFVEITMGQSPDSSAYNDKRLGLPFHQGVTGFGLRFPTNETWSTVGKRFADKGDILFSVRAPVGRINVAYERIILGRGLSAMRQKDGYQSWLFYALKEYFRKEDMIGGGCIFASTTKDELHGVKISMPTKDAIERFEKLSRPIDADILSLSQQIRSLTEARDRLLPKLMKGEIAV